MSTTASRGPEVSTELDVAIVALAQDCEATLPAALGSVESMARTGLRIHLYVGENGSRDRTLSLLQRANPDLVSVVDTSEVATEPNRLRRIARARTMVARAAKDGGSAASVLVVDLDEPFLGTLTADVLAGASAKLAQDPDHFAMAAVSRPYYDLLAYEDDEHSYVGLDRRLRASRRRPWKYWTLFRDEVYPAQWSLTSPDPREAISAFNGLCLYRADDYFAGSYLQSEDESIACEHVVLNRQLAELTGQRMVLDPTLVVPAPPEHVQQSIVEFFWRRARKAVGALVAKATSRT